MVEPYRISIFKDSLGNECYFVIDTIFKGVSVGGVRIHKEVNLQEVKDLARHMSYKLALFDLPKGGAKVGIKLQDGSTKRQALINFTKELKPFIEKTIFLPGKDLGTTEEDIALIYQGVSKVKYQSHSSYYTAVGINYCLEFIKNKWGYRNLNVALSGFGDAGYFLVKKFIGQRINLVAISNIHGCVYNKSGLDKEELILLKERFNDECLFNITKEILPRETLYTIPADVLIAGAEAYAINNRNVSYIKAKFICPAANIPYQAGITERLKDRGIIFFPDFVTNSGGVLGGELFYWGFSAREIEEKVKSKIHNILIYLFENSRNNFYDLALSLAEDRVRLRNELENKYKKIYSLRKKFFFLKNIMPMHLRKKCYKYILGAKFNKYKGIGLEI